MEAELVEFELGLRLVRILGPLLHLGQAFSFLASWLFGSFLLGRSWLVEHSVGMDMADEVSIGRQVRQNTLAALGTVAADQDVIVGKPLGHKMDQFESQFRPCAMVWIVFGRA